MEASALPVVFHLETKRKITTYSEVVHIWVLHFFQNHLQQWSILGPTHFPLDSVVDAEYAEAKRHATRNTVCPPPPALEWENATIQINHDPVPLPEIIARCCFLKAFCPWRDPRAELPQLTAHVVACVLLQVACWSSSTVFTTANRAWLSEARRHCTTI